MREGATSPRSAGGVSAPGSACSSPGPSPHGTLPVSPRSKASQRNKHVAMGRKKFNMDPKKVRGWPAPVDKGGCAAS